MKQWASGEDESSVHRRLVPLRGIPVTTKPRCPNRAPIRAAARLARLAIAGLTLKTVTAASARDQVAKMRCRLLRIFRSDRSSRMASTSK